LGGITRWRVLPVPGRVHAQNMTRTELHPPPTEARPGPRVESVTTGAGRDARARDRLTRLLPGVLIVGTITAVATILGDRAPVIGAPVFAILIGMLATVIRAPGPSIAPGVGFVAKRVLQASIVVLGFGLSADQVMRVGVESMPVLLGSLT